MLESNLSDTLWKKVELRVSSLVTVAEKIPLLWEYSARLLATIR